MEHVDATLTCNAQHVASMQVPPKSKPPAAADDAPATGRAAAAAAFQTLTQFLAGLASGNAGGRVLLTHAAAPGGVNAPACAAEIKWVLLDAGSKFRDSLAAARAVVLASGTLAPLDLLTSQLCRAEDHSRLQRFQCGHVVPPERVLALGLGVGPRGRAIRLTHGSRDAEAVLDECGLLLVALCRIVPQGLVAFVPSFAYADKLRTRCASLRIFASCSCLLLCHCTAKQSRLSPVYQRSLCNGQQRSKVSTSSLIKIKSTQVGGKRDGGTDARPEACVLRSARGSSVRRGAAWV